MKIILVRRRKKTKKTTRSKKSKYIFFIILIILIPSKLAGAKGEEDYFLFLGNKNMEPLIYEENNKTKGLLVDIMKELSKRIDHKIEVQALDWREAQEKILAGEADALIQINKNVERENLYDFSSELLKSEFSIFKKCENTKINGIEDLKNKKVGVEALGYPRYLLEGEKNIEIVIIPNWTMGFKMIESGIIDAVVVDKWIGQYALTKSKISGVNLVKEALEENYSYIAVSKGNDELLRLINQGLAEMENDGQLNKILDYWKGENVIYYTEKEVKKNLYYTGLGIFILSLLAGIVVVIKLRKINRDLELKVEERTSELNKMNKELERISTIDALSNVYNRRHFDKVLKRTWDLSLRENKPLTLILLDIDYFKDCNDTYGHLGGDEYLKTIAKILKDSAKRPGDLFARFGGEEFVYILYNTPEKGGINFAEKIRKLVEETSVYYEGHKINCTVSVGLVSLVPNENMEAKDLIKIADEAMYKAKTSGRNRLVVGNKENY